MARMFRKAASRRAQVDALDIGESTVFYAPAGMLLQRLQASLAVEFLKMGGRTYSQQKALLVFDETEAPQLCSVVRRVS